MMKSLTRLSAWIILAGILSLSPVAFAQPASRQPVQRNSDQGGGNGCGNQGGGGNGWGGGWGWDGWGGGGGGNNGGCTTVPEGGTALLYLAIAGLCCFGAAVVRSRQQIGATEAS
jgi:hypothetical protein